LLFVYFSDSLNVHGIEIRWAMLDHFPADIEGELTQSTAGRAGVYVRTLGN
jgi:hypothetical protein